MFCSSFSFSSSSSSSSFSSSSYYYYYYYSNDPTVDVVSDSLSYSTRGQSKKELVRGMGGNARL